jgi:signal transduction histidine kinase
MDELSLYVLDITMNSVRAGATEISIDLIEEGEWLTFTVRDNGCGMTEEQVKKLSDPFFTTRKTRKVGLGIPFLKMLAEMTGGRVEITSVHESVSETHGTETVAVFGKNHIDFILSYFNICFSAACMDNHIDFAFIHSNGNVSYNIR